MPTKIISTFIFILLFSWGANAAVPEIVDYQGYLKQSGTAVNGTKSMTFSLYDASTGGAQLCTSGAQNVNVTNGLFSYKIGSAGCNLSTINWDNAVYLEIAVDGVALTPREQVTGMSYLLQTQAINVVFAATGNVAATNVQSAIAELDTEKLDKTGGTLSGALTVNADITSSATMTAQYFVGNGSLLSNLNLSAADHNTLSNLTTGDVHTQYFNLSQAETVAGALTMNNVALNMSGANGDIAFDNAGGAISNSAAAVQIADDLSITGAATVSANLAVDTDTLVADSANNRVGIGTVNPANKLHIQPSVNGEGLTVWNPSLGIGQDVVIRIGTQSSVGDEMQLAFTNNGTGSANNTFSFNFNAVSPPALLLRADGKVGIGTVTPANVLDVEGSAAIGAAYSGTSAAPANGLIVQGNVGIGKNTAATALDVNGTVTATQFVGGGAGLTGVVASGAVAKAGDVMNGALGLSQSGATATVYAYQTGTTKEAGYFSVTDAANTTAALSGINAGTAGSSVGVFGQVAGSGSGVYGSNSSTGYGVYGLSMSTTTGKAGYFNNNNAGNTVAALSGVTSGTAVTSYGVYGSAAGSGHGLYGTVSGGGNGVYGVNTSNGIGVQGLANGTGYGVEGNTSSNGTSVFGYSTGAGATLFGGNHTGGSGYLMWLQSGGAIKLATDRSGNVFASGTVTATAFSGDGAALTNVVASGAVSKLGDTVNGTLGIASTSATATLSVYQSGTTAGAGYFSNTSPSNSMAALYAETNGLNSAIYGYSGAAATGRAATFQTMNGSNTSDVVYAWQQGTGALFAGNHAGASGNLLQLQSAVADKFVVSKAGAVTANVNSAGNALTLNQTGAGDIFHLQSGGVDTFAINNIGTVTYSRPSGNAQIVLKATGGNWQSAMTYANAGGTPLWNLYNDTAAAGAQTFSIKDAVAGADRLFINPSGNLGVGTTTPANKLDVEGGAAIGATYSGASAAPANGLIVEGNVGIGTSIPTNKFHVDNTAATGNGAYFTTSNAANTTGQTIYSLNAGGSGSRAGYFENNNAVNTACSIWANNTGGGEALCGTVRNTTSTSSAIKIDTDGDGKAAYFSVTKAANTNDAVYISHDGAGSGTTAALEVVTTNGAHGIYGHTSGATGRAGKFIIDNASNDNDVVYIETASVVGGTTLGRLIDTNKGAYLTNTGIWTDASSIKYKKDITPLTQEDDREMLNVVKGIEVVRYRYKDEKPGQKMTIGVIAESAPDEMTDDTKTGVQTVKAVGMLIAAMQAQQEIIEELRGEIEALKSQRSNNE